MCKCVDLPKAIAAPIHKEQIYSKVRLRPDFSPTVSALAHISWFDLINSFINDAEDKQNSFLKLNIN